jgi:hypothetical protein
MFSTFHQIAFLRAVDLGGKVTEIAGGEPGKTFPQDFPQRPVEGKTSIS